MKKSLISAIKKLLTKLGAEEVEGNNLVEVIDSGADAIEGGGGNTPIKILFTGMSSSNASCDTDYNTVCEAILSNTPIIAMQRDSSIDSGAPILYCSLTLSNYYIYNGTINGGITFTKFSFGSIGSNSKALDMYTYTLNSNNSVTINTTTQTFTNA